MALGLFGLLACSGEQQEAGGASDREPAVADTDWLEPNHTPAKNLVVLAVDGLRLGAWPAEPYPNLATLIHQGRAFQHHVVDSMGSQAQLASLFSGLPPAEHAVGSMHERGRTFLPPEIPWWPEALQAQGWRTIASAATPQMGPRVGGMQRGFDEFFEPALLPGSYRPGERVALVMHTQWAECLQSGDPFFVLQHLADFANPGKMPSPAVLQSAQRTLQTWVARYPALAQAANEVGQGPQEFEEVRRALGRSRGSEVLQAFHESIYVGQLKDLDAAVGRLVADLKTAGRLQDTVIALVALRGSIIGTVPSEGPAFPPEVVRSPLVIWAPGRVKPGVDDALLPTHAAGRRLAYLMGLEVGGWSSDRVASTIWDAAYSRRASIGKDLHVEENAAAGWLAFQREGSPLMNKEALSAEHSAQWEAVQAHAQENGLTWGYRVAFDVPAGETWTLHWRLLRGRVRDQRAEPSDRVEWVRKRRLSGTARLTGQGELTLSTYQREEPLLIAWEGTGREPQASTAPRLWMVRPSREVEPSPEPGETPASPTWAAQVLRDSGLWTRVLVTGDPGRPVEVLAALVPSAQDAGRAAPELEITTDAQHQVEAIPGRTDALRLLAPTPINSQFKELPPFELALGIRLDGRWLATPELGLEQGRWTPRGQAALYVPDWWPGLTESLHAAEGWPLLEGLTLHRLNRDIGGHRALDPEASEYVQHMGKGE